MEFISIEMSDHLQYYEVKQILKRRLKRGEVNIKLIKLIFLNSEWFYLFDLFKVQYYLKLANTPNKKTGKEECTWEPAVNLTDCADLLNEFILSKAQCILGKI